MSEQTCRCGKPTRDEAYSCDDCSQALAVALGEVPWLDDELETTISRQRGIDYRTVGGGKGGKKDNERPAPANLGASEARTNLKAVMVSWALFCRDEQVRNSSPSQDLPTDDLKALSRWLMWRVDGLALLDIGPDAVDEITSAVAHCRRLVDRPADARFYGRCHCGEWLYAKPGSDVVQCRYCGETSDTAKLNADMWERAMDRRVTIAEARALANRMGFEVPESTMFRWVAKWVKDKRLIQSEDRKFSFRDLSALIEATRANTTEGAA